MITLMAWRNIWRNPARSLIIMSSIALGLFAGISVLGLYKGMMKSRVRTVIDKEVGHIQIHHSLFSDDLEAGYLLPSKKNLEGLRNLPAVKEVCYRTLAPAMLSTATGSAGVILLGIDPDAEKRVSGLDKKLIEGTYFSGKTRNPVLIGKKLADKLKLHLRSKVVVMFTDSANNMISAACRVAGIFESENAPLDQRSVYIPSQIINHLLGMEQASHEMCILLHTDESLEDTYLQMKNLFPLLKIEKWQDLSPETALLVDVANQYSIIIITIIMLALAFGIINTMLMAILERTREIGMLMALGMSKAKVFALILNETLYLTLAGFPFGLFFSWTTIAYFNRVGINLSAFREELMKSFGFSQIIYPEFPSEQLTKVVLIVVSTALISGLFPALKALSLKPVDALRK